MRDKNLKKNYFIALMSIDLLKEAPIVNHIEERVSLKTMTSM